MGGTGVKEFLKVSQAIYKNDNINIIVGKMTKHLTKEQKDRLISSFEEKSHADFLRDVQMELSKNGFYDKFIK